MYCKNCGTENEAEVKFCKTCGMTLEQAEETVAQPETVQMPQPETVQMPQAAPVQMPPVAPAPQYAQQPYAAPQYAQPYDAPQYAQPTYPTAPESKLPKIFSIIGMVAGILALVFCWIPGVSFMGLIFGSIGIVFGAIAKSKGGKSGMATAGIVCGAIGCGLALSFTIVYCVACPAASYSSSYYDWY